MGAKGGKGSKGGRKRRLNHSKTEKEKLKLLQREKPGGVKAYKLKKMQAQMEMEMRKAGKFGKGVSEI
jgi:cytochrome c551/c552